MGCGASAESPVAPKRPSEPRVLKAEALIQSGKNDEALCQLDRIIADWPDCARAYVARARIRTEGKQPEAAIADLDSAITIQHNYVSALLMRSKAHLSLAHLDEAGKDCASGLRLDPENGQLLALKAEIQALTRSGSATKLESGSRVRSGITPPSISIASSGVCDDGSVSTSAMGDQTDPLQGGHQGGGSNLEEGGSWRGSGNFLADALDPFAGIDTPSKGGGASGKLCMICMDRERGCRLKPCMHAALCVDCAEDLRSRDFCCPICDTRIQGVEPGDFTRTYAVEDIKGLAAAATAAASDLRSPCTENGGAEVVAALGRTLSRVPEEEGSAAVEPAGNTVDNIITE